MDRVVSVAINGVTYTLNYSVSVMFDVNEKYGGVQKALDALSQVGKAGFADLQWFLLRLAEEGELARREEGYEPAPFLKAADISMRKMKPMEFADLREAVKNAITLGFMRELPSDGDEEVDVGLQELDEKKTKAGA